MSTTFQTLRNILARDYELAPEHLQPETELAQIEVDSLGVIELIFTLEDEFNVTAEDTGRDFKTLGDIVAYIDQLVAEREAHGEPDATPVTETASAE